MLLWTLGHIGSFELVFMILRYNPSSGFLDQKAVLFLVFWGNSILFSTVAAPVCPPTNSALGFPFLHNLSKPCGLLICCVLGHYHQKKRLIFQCTLFTLVVTLKQISKYSLILSFPFRWVLVSQKVKKIIYCFRFNISLVDIF